MSSPALRLAALAIFSAGLVAACGGNSPQRRAASGNCTAGNPHPLTQDLQLGGGDPAVAWSPDGRKLAFVSGRSGIDLVYLMNADGSDQGQVSRLGNDNDPAWSPDGHKVAFAADAYGFDQIYAINADGSGQQQLTHTKEGGSTEPAWSPDGHELAFANEFGENGILVMDADGHHQHRLTSGEDQYPAWAPDGRKIVFARQPAGKRGYQLYVMNADGSGTHQLTRHGLLNDWPSWSPDGSKIAFASVSGCKTLSYACAAGLQIYVMNSDGSHRQRMTRPGIPAFYPRWAPGGRKIAFGSVRGAKQVIDVMTVRCR
jgi:Tol biopolymer transport system component